MSSTAWHGRHLLSFRPCSVGRSACVLDGRGRTEPQGVANVADAWRPANELEHRMRETLQAGDQEAYFRLLAEAELVIPVPPDRLEDVLANRAELSWPTREEDGRVHVPAFTSAAAMREALGPAQRHFLRLKFSDVAASWPDGGWWLAVNPGLPIEARLSSWFIRQLTEGDPRPPRAGRPAGDRPQQPARHAAPAEQAPTAPLTGVAAAAPSGQVPAAAQQAAAAEPQPPAGAKPEPGAAPQSAEETVPLPGPHGPAAVAETPAEQAPEPPAEATAPAAPSTAGQEPRFQPANDVERELLRALAGGDQDAYLKVLAAAEVLLPIPPEADYSLRPGRAGFPWQTGEIEGRTVVPVFTSVERMRDLIGEGPVPGRGDHITVPFTAVARYWPDPSWDLAVNSGSPVGATLPGERLRNLSEWADQIAAQRMVDGFEPQNDIERRLFEAAVRRDGEAFFKVLAGAQALIPADPQTPWGIRPDDPEFPWRPVPVRGMVAIQAFTSLKWMHETIGPSRFIMPSFLELMEAWPQEGWTLVVNPATPINAVMPSDRIRALAEAARPAAPRPEAPPAAAERPPAQAEPAAAAPQPVPAPQEAGERPAEGASAPAQETDWAPHRAESAEPEPPFQPGNRIDQELYEAALSGDTDAFLRVLLAASVLVPIPEDAPLEVTPVQPEFRWDAALRDGSAVQVFTSLLRLREVLPSSRFVYADFRELITSWPRADWAMALNPGTRIGASLEGDQVQALSEWAVRVGLIRPRPAEPADPAQTVADLAQAVADPTQTTVDPAQTVADPAQTVTDLEAVPAGRDSRYAPEPDEEDAALMQPVVMQKVLPHGHVGWYLEQGYDRVSGFVHPISDVTDLQTPVQLYEALGLLYEGSPFSPSDEGVYVIRWPAYCPGLYRIPFGGQTEQEVRAWGEAGWVQERPPFRGDGFAPGSAGSIREYKVDSARLPYGAEMYYLGKDRTERFIAMYDPDRLAWVRPDEEEAK